MLSWLHDFFWIQQDYLWFLAGMGWLVVGMLWWQGRGTLAMPAWVPWSAGTGIAIACIQVAILTTPMAHPVPFNAPGITGDMCLGIALAVQAAGWWVAGLHGIRFAVLWIALIGAVALAAGGWRYLHPNAGSLIVGGLLLAAGGWLMVQGGRVTRQWHLALLTTCSAALLDTTGPVISVLDGPQRWWDLNPFGPWSALAQCMAAGMTLAIRWHSLRATDPEPRPDDRWFAAGAITWLAAGMLLAVAVGLWGRRAFEQSALARVQSTAALLPRPNIDTLLDDRLQIGDVIRHSFPNGGMLPVAYSEHASIHTRVVDEELKRLLPANPDLRSISVATLRNGWLLTTAVAQPNAPPRARYGEVTLLRPATLADETEWRDRTGSVSGPVLLSPAEYVFSRTALVDRAGRMLGWLMFDFSPSHWLAAQAQPRALAYLIVALGLVVGQQRVTQLRRARERDRAEARAAALAQANELKTTFLATVSHELRTPLQSFLGYTELMLPEANPRDRVRLLAMREHAALMSRLVNDLIDLSAAECGKFQLIERPVALGELVTQAAESLRPTAEAKGLTYTIVIESGFPAGVQADPQRVRQVVLNLVGNAIKFTDHGRVEVTLACAAQDSARAEIELRVADTGPGIAPEVQPHLFAAFSRLAPTVKREGTGLGLAIVAAVSKAMGGDVSVASDGRRGTTFTARWRLRVAAAPAPADPGRVPLHGKRILVADDNALVRDLFIAYLTECGAVCAPAVDGVEAIARLHNEPFDAVVLDLAMPRLDGLATVRQLRQDAAARPWRIVGVSAHAGGAEHQDALAAGMDVFLTKPVALPDLARSLAPVTGWIPPEPAFAPVRAHFEHRFRSDAPIQGAAIAAALAEESWPALERAAHHLRNSAGVVGDSELVRACAALEAAARAADAVAAAAAWEQCRGALARWQAGTT